MPPVLIVLFSLFAWSQRGLYEDGFFILRVVDVFLHSGDLSYNPDERHETNTDFLWTLLLILGVAAGMNDILWLYLLGVAIYAAALCATFVLARKLFSNWESALVALVLLGGHFSFAHYAVTGFAPVLQALAALCCLLALLRFGESPNPRSGAALGFALFFLALCRLDSAVFGLPLVLCAIWLAWRNGKSALSGITLALGIPSVLFGGVLLWKLSYYGDILPATYYAKAATRGREEIASYFLTRGAGYVLLYWQRYFLWVLAGVAAFGAWRLFKSKEKPKAPRRPRVALLWAMAAMCVLSSAYMLRTGGDVYEFRFMMPQSPMMMILAAAGMRGVARNWRWTVVTAAVCVSVWHWQDTSNQYGLPIVSTIKGDELPMRHASFVKTRMMFDNGIRHEFDFRDAPREEQTELDRWLIGKALRDLFGHLGNYPPNVKVSFSAGGHMAYVSRVRVLEEHGLTDSRVGKANLDDIRFMAAGRPSIGHNITPKPKLLVRLGVNLVTQQGSHPAPFVDFSRLSEGHRLAWAYNLMTSPNNGQLPADSQLFKLPLSDGRFAAFVYIIRNETIDQILDERGIERVNVF